MLVKRGIVLAIMLGCSLIGCQKTLEVDLPESDPQIVINSYFDVVEASKLSVYKSQPINKNARFAFEKDARLTIKRNGNEVSFEVGDDEFTMNDIFESGDKISIHVALDGVEDAYAAVEIPGKVNLEDFNATTINTFKGFDSYEEQVLKVKFTDPVVETNYYMLQIYRQLEGFNEKILTEGFPDIDDVFNLDNGSVIFSDEIYNGKQVEIALRFESYYAGGDVTVCLTNISRAYYRYLKSAQIQQENIDNPFAEPATIQSNIENGLGIVGCGATTFLTKSVEIEYTSLRE